ncbi:MULTISPECIES: COG3014 family protein [unclassified Vibrio]|uniref:COG3014 family protein n=1 Tax=Vibrio sp. HB236076 TaxID=3232307 RepID=A0AB39HH73_9VIBR|nr:hypothetical protein [Vibrio sp. HB161653]MDP5255127.1 hypothetical protein [Vibrio sp. HB161653]
MALISSCLLTLTACSSLSMGNLFSHYTAQHQSVYQDVKRGDYQAALNEQSNQAIGGDILDNLELGRIAWLAGDPAQSFTALQAGQKAVEKQQNKALISLSDTSDSIAALAVNENVNAYTPSDYELGFLHLYLGLNYIQRNDLEGALVEMRLANQVQEEAERVRQASLSKQKTALSEQGLSANIGQVLARYPTSEGLSGYQNAYLFFLSALLYQAQGNNNDAYVDLKRALAVAPTNPQVIAQTKALAQSLAIEDDLDLLRAYSQPVTQLKANQGRVIVIAEKGTVEALQGWQLSLPILSRSQGVNLYSVALPYYPQQRNSAPIQATLGNQSVDFSLLMDVNTMANYHLRERLPSLVFRQMIRLIAKTQISRQAGNGGFGLALNVWNALTEQPDTRSWQTLPAVVYSASQVLSEGKYPFSIAGQSFDIDVSAGETSLVILSNQAMGVHLLQKKLGKIQ